MIANRWLLHLLGLVPLVCNFGSDSGGGSGDNSEAEEARKDELRRKVDAMYGVGGTKKTVYLGPNNQEFETPDQASAAWSSASGHLPGVLGTRQVDDPVAGEASTQMGKEQQDIAGATRGYYTDDLSRGYQKAERSTRFRLARQGLLGGSADADLQAEVTSDRDLGATRIDDAVRRSVSGLKTQREQERLNAVNLINSGSGDAAVTAAQKGLENSLENARSADKANLFGDLFSTAANAGAASNNADYASYLANRYRNAMSTYFPTSGQSGRVSATS